MENPHPELPSLPARPAGSRRLYDIDFDNAGRVCGGIVGNVVDAAEEVNDAQNPGPSFEGPVSVVNSTCQFGGNNFYNGPVTMMLPDDAGVMLTSSKPGLSEEAAWAERPGTSKEWNGGKVWHSLRPWQRTVLLVGGLLLVLALCTTLVLILLRGAEATTISSSASSPSDSAATTGVTPDPRDSEGLVSRQGWRAVPPKLTSPLKTPVETVIVHHTAMSHCFDDLQCQANVREIQRLHMNAVSDGGYNWNDIGYNFLVGGDGHSYEGRGWNFVGAHTKNWNSLSLGVALMGNFCSTPLPAQQLEALRQLLRLGQSLGMLHSNYAVLGRCQLTGDYSPGTAAMVEIRTLSHWENNSLAQCAACEQSVTTPKTTSSTSSRRITPSFAPTSSQQAELSTSPDPRIAAGLVSRHGWAATAARASTQLTIPVRLVIVSHTMGAGCSEDSVCQARVRSIQKLHMDPKPSGNGWDDIGFNFLVGGDGHSYEGRGWDVVGSHTYGWNTVSLGVALIGNFCSTPLPTVQLDALRRLLSLGESLGVLRSDYTLKGRCQFRGGSSPGTTALQDIETLSHWNNESHAKCLSCRAKSSLI